MAGGKLEFD